MVTIRPYKRSKLKGWEADISIRLPDGKWLRERVRCPLATKSAALRWAQEREALILRNGGKLTAPPPTEKKEVPTLEAFKDRWIEGHAKANRQKPSTIYAKESILRAHLVPALGAKRLDEITEEDIQRLKAALAEKKPKTVNNVLVVLGKLLRTAVRWRVIDAMPVQLEPVKVDGSASFEFYDFEHLADLREAAAKVGKREIVVVLLGAQAGLRAGEMAALEWTDVDLKRRILSVARNAWKTEIDTTKGGRTRHIPMTTDLAAALKALRHLAGPRVLVQEDGKPFTYKLLRGCLRAAQRRAQLEATGNLHVLRHTFCSHLAMRGAPAKVIQELAGHAHLTTTMRYMHLSTGATTAAIGLLEAGPKVSGTTSGTADV
jgi:integrase